MFALLTNRAILIGRATTIHHMYDPPSLPGLFADFPFVNTKNINFVGGGDKSDGPGTPFMNSLVCGNISQWDEYTAIYFVTNQYLGAPLLNNPHYKTFFSDMFGVDVFGPLFNFLFVPKPHYLAAAQDLKEKYFDGNYVVGMHLRKEYIKTVLNQGVFWRCAQLISMQSSYPPEKRKFYVASDDNDFVHEATSYLGAQALTANSLTDSKDSNLFVMLDILLVGASDELIMTPHSTFSQIIYGAVGKLPWFVTEVNTCVKQPHTNPCYFYLSETLKQSPCVMEVNDENNLQHTLLFLNQRNCYTNYQWGVDHT